MHRFMRAFVVPLLLVILATVVVGVTVSLNAARLVADLGTLFVMFANILYIVTRDPGGAWGQLSRSERLVRLLTFRR